MGGNTALLKVQSLASETHCCVGFSEVEVKKDERVFLCSEHTCKAVSYSKITSNKATNQVNYRFQDI
jgi:hypothetical protein